MQYRATRNAQRQAAQLPKQLKEILKRLKNLLKLPKARRWVYCEFFYSDIDRELLLSESEFRLCLRDSFPNLKTRNLTRTEWRQIRRLIGKPRRCSQAFFDEERQVLEQKRRRIRDIYKGKGSVTLFCSFCLEVIIIIKKVYLKVAKITNTQIAFVRQYSNKSQNIKNIKYNTNL